MKMKIKINFYWLIIINLVFLKTTKNLVSNNQRISIIINSILINLIIVLINLKMSMKKITN